MGPFSGLRHVYFPGVLVASCKAKKMSQDKVGEFSTVLIKVSLSLRCTVYLCFIEISYC